MSADGADVTSIDIASSSSAAAAAAAASSSKSLISLIDQLGQDSVLVESDRGVFVCAHLSNSIIQFKAQFDALCQILSLYRSRSVFLMGDFNARPFVICSPDSSNIFGFYPKNIAPASRTLENAIISINLEDRDVSLQDPTACTTTKMRLLTSQTDKILFAASDVIDNIICFSPSYSYLSPNVNKIVYTKTKAFDRVIMEQEICPVNWPSDHYLVECLIHDNVIATHGKKELIGGEVKTKTGTEDDECPLKRSCLAQQKGSVFKNSTLRIMTLNGCGESINSETAYNWAEFASQSFLTAYNEQTAVRSAFEDIIKVQPLIHGEHIKTPKLFKLLRDVEIINFHKPPPEVLRCLYSDNINKLFHKHCLKLGIPTDSNGNVIRWDESVGFEDKVAQTRFILSLFDQFVSHPVLSELFVNLFNEISSKPKIALLDVVMNYISESIDNIDRVGAPIDVFAIQELSQFAKESFIRSMHWFQERGYSLVFKSAEDKSSSVPADTKTCGLIILRL